MKRFFDFPPTLLQYFQKIDRRFGNNKESAPLAAKIACYEEDFSLIRAVLWDVYGTLCGVELGDLEGALEYDDRQLVAAKATVDEFSLKESLNRLQNDQPTELTLRNLYRQLIEDSHLRSLANGVEYPEVVIEQVWLKILQDCSDHGFEFPPDEPPLHSAYRIAYFFEYALQRIYLYPYADETLEKLKKAGIVQGIISNAQFYTPLHLRRLLRAAQNRDDLELEHYFNEPLVMFSYESGYSKPNLRSFRRAMETLSRQGIAPDETLYIGNDMLNDVWAACRCGLRTVLFAGDENQAVLRKDEPRCKNLRPDAVVTNLRHIVRQILPDR